MILLRNISTLCLSLLLVFSSCTKDSTIINILCGTDTNGNNPSGNSAYDVNFIPGVNPIATRSGTTLLQQNRYVAIYSYIFLGDFVDSVTYFSSQPGTLTPANGEVMKLLPGTYEFFAIGIANKEMTPPVFTDTQFGQYRNLSNGIDYISGYIYRREINANTTLNLTMNHICSQIILNITSSDSNVTIDSLGLATMATPDKNNVYLSLITGDIKPATSLSTQTIAMNRNGLSYNQIIFPMLYKGTIPVNFDVYLNGNKTAYNYTVNIPMINDALDGGNSYVYSVSVDTEHVTFGTVNIRDWTEVNESGTPIIATPL